MNVIDTLREWINMCAAYLGPNPILQAFVIVVISLIIARAATMILTRVIGRLTRLSETHIDDQLITMLKRPVFLTVLLIGSSLLPLLQNIAFMVVILAAIYALMNAWGIDVTALVASAGILGLALSFAAKDTLANVFAGVSILADSPYKVGDFVVLGSGERGKVTQIGIRSTRLLTRDDVEITIPNAVIGNAKIINETGGPHEKYRVRSKISIAYHSDLPMVCDLLKEVAVSMPGVCNTPEPRVRVREFADNGINIELLSWVPQPVDRGRVLHELNLKIFAAFKEHNVEIPYPQQEVYVKNLNIGES